MQVRLQTYTPQYQNNPSFKAFDANMLTHTLHQTKSILNKTSDRSTSYLALGLGKLASLKSMQNLVNWLKNKNYQEHLAAFVGCTLSGFYMLDTARSKTIEKDQKPALIINQGTVCAMSTIGAYTLNHYLNKKINHIAELFHIAKIEDKKIQRKFEKFITDPDYANVVKRAAKNNPKVKDLLNSFAKKFEFNEKVKVYVKEEIKKLKGDEAANNFLKEIKNIVVPKGKDKAEIIKELYLKRMKNSKALQRAYNREAMNNAIKKIAGAEATGKMTRMMNGFKTAQALMVFALIYRFVSPVVATPIANKVSEKLEAGKKAKNKNNIK